MDKVGQRCFSSPLDSTRYRGGWCSLAIFRLFAIPVSTLPSGKSGKVGDFGRRESVPGRANGVSAV